ncbi:hypothetical protein [Aliiroseovarius sediminis]|uniref:hypothetical protein n=1 Tax=Aliiroseovarius sediminis TaxID=2925839 RepID=UPI001F5982CE|nr:hypothetical protein [Aliiroseovarius sediminis]MCI2393280.1 hypothetical protein [Aliiroseovarius sediminis]
MPHLASTGISIIEQFLTWLQQAFNNREIAIGLWIILGFSFCLTRADLRRSLWCVAKTLIAPKLLLFFGIVALNVVALSWLLAGVGLWSKTQVPPTVLWFAMGGCVFAGRALQSKEDDQYFRDLFRGSLRLGGIFEFIVVAYTFSLATELVLTPVLFFLAATLAFAGTKPEYAKAKVLLEFSLATFVIVLVYNSVSSIWSQPDMFFTTDTVRNFVLPILLTIGSIPVFYLLFCYSHIEQARIQIDQKTFQSDDLKQYARRRFFLIFPLRPWLLRRATRQFRILPAKTKTDVDRIISDILNYERNEEAPPAVDPTQGWSPFEARDFLKEQGLRTNDYHKGDDEYWASSNYVELDSHILPNKAVFYIEGLEDIVTTLKLTGKFMDDFDSGEAIQKLRVIGALLCEKAIGYGDIAIDSLIPNSQVFENEMIIDGATIRAWGKRYPSDRGFEVFLALSR